MSPRPRSLTALPVFNEAAHVCKVLDQVVRHADDVLVVDDGSTDGTSDLLAARTDVQVVRHPENRGYGAALRSAFCHAMRNDYDVVVTIDCDGQHEPQRIQSLITACDGVDIVSGSRYLETFHQDTKPAPADRRRINQTITAELNERLGLSLTDAFCGFKAYRVEALRKLVLQDDGYAMPLEFWVQAAAAGLSIREVAVPLIYLDEKRSFGGALDIAEQRLAHYRDVIDRAQARVAERRGRGQRQAAPMEMC
ncbi:Undecaprenyl-phosphate mannosyltransferase [Pirellulimonas nuda]|uniref:Undecaprenyl-phosphate mannosyltransferase n=1 Tax=Pirellulimonas nuda TaxID=2528009 RepID=A0A518D5Q5_9BACT|nr:glycosyltransferase family 2 protein [Pirellulimonas nuda]QDU86803.1 Undecaprenyl-phosphate mannosyltransferase [Pirellulimonas nuda]